MNRKSDNSPDAEAARRLYDEAQATLFAFRCSTHVGKTSEFKKARAIGSHLKSFETLCMVKGALLPKALSDWAGTPQEVVAPADVDILVPILDTPVEQS